MHTMIRMMNEGTSKNASPARATLTLSTRYLLGAAAVFLFASALGLQAQQSVISQPLSRSQLTYRRPWTTSPAAHRSPPARAYSPASTSALFDTQPPPRRTYSRPHYSDKSHNADGSNRYTFEFGGGLTIPTGTTRNDLTTGYKFQVGGGRNFNDKFATLIQFDWDNFGFQTATLNKQLAIYNNEINAFNTANPGANIPPLTQLGGTSHAWSISVDPMYNFMQSDKWGGYVVGAAGFYHKTADFTVPTVATECTFYGCFQYQANQSYDKYTSNAPGFNGGGGITYKGSRFSNVKLYAEVRYVYILNQARTFSEGSSNTKYYNVFPQNSARTSYIPIAFGVRF